MQSKKFKKFEFRKEAAVYVIEEDVVGWYLIAYINKKSSEDYLFDSLEEALLEAEERFDILRENWKEVS